MPELPEVETIRLQLDQFITGSKIAGIEVLEKKSFVGNPNEVTGKRVLGVKRRAKILLIELKEETCLAIHLKLTGQLIYRKNAKEECAVEEFEEKKGPFETRQMPCKYTRVIIDFKGKGRLYFNDLRKFGWVKVLKTTDAYQDLAELKRLGPEANSEKDFTLEYFKDILSKTKKPVKLVILDQEKLAGVGNIYANEALFMARILPTKSANLLSAEEADRLRKAIISVLNESIKYKGTSDRDEAYRQISGQKGEYQKHLRVYGKAGESCPAGSGKIKRIALGGRGTFYCSECQK